MSTTRNVGSPSRRLEATPARVTAARPNKESWVRSARLVCGVRGCGAAVATLSCNRCRIRSAPDSDGHIVNMLDGFALDSEDIWTLGGRALKAWRQALGHGTPWNRYAFDLAVGIGRREYRGRPQAAVGLE